MISRRCHRPYRRLCRRASGDFEPGFGSSLFSVTAQAFVRSLGRLLSASVRGPLMPPCDLQRPPRPTPGCLTGFAGLKGVGHAFGLASFAPADPGLLHLGGHFKTLVRVGLMIGTLWG